MTSNPEGTKKYTGGCHCGAVRFEVELASAVNGTMCNCTICSKLAVVGTHVKPASFRLISNAESLGSYEWGTKVAQRKFCKQCGVHCFGAGHLEMLGGDFVSVNLNTLDEFDLSKATIGYWDGRHNNWQAGLRPAPWPV